MTQIDWRDYIYCDSKILRGKPVIKGTRLSVEFLLGLLAQGWTEEQILENYPTLTKKSLRAVFVFVQEHMDCEFCEGVTKQKMVTKHHWYKGKLYIVENVAAEVCTECGERYFHATVLDKIDRLLAEEHQVKQHITVEVVSFG